MIVMDSKAQLTVEIIAKIVEGRITIANGAKLLSKCQRIAYICLSKMNA